MESTPANGATDVPVDEPIVFRFSEPMDPATIDGSTVLAHGPLGPVSGAVEYDIERSEARFVAAPRLPLAAMVEARVTTGATNAIGAPLAEDFIVLFTTRDGEFRAPELVGADAGRALVPAALALSDTGEGFALWTRELDDGRELWAARYVPGQGWERPQFFAGGAGSAVGLGAAPLVALGGGRALAAWHAPGERLRSSASQEGEAAFEVHARAYDPDLGGFGPPFALDLPGARDARDASLARLSSASAAALWVVDGTGSVLRGADWRPESGLGALIELDAAEIAIEALALRANRAGDLTAAWSRRDAAEEGALSRASVRARDGAWLGASSLSAEGLAPEGAPLAALAAASLDAAVLWSEGEENVGALSYAALHAPESPGTWQDPELVAGDAGELHRARALGMDVDGRTFALFESVATDPESVASAAVHHRSPGAGWELELLEAGPLLERVPSGLSVGPRSALALWAHAPLDPELRSMRAREFRPESGWSELALVGGAEPGRLGDPAVAHDFHGHALAAWAAHPAGTLDAELWTFRRADGTSSGAPKLLARFAGGEIAPPLVAFDPSGGALILAARTLPSGGTELWAVALH